MRSLWKALLFLHGYVANPQLARRLADDAAGEMPRAPDAAPLSHPEAMRRLVEHGHRLSRRLCQGIGGGIVHRQ